MGERLIIIAVMSGKGGVGKTTCALGTALALKNLDQKVGILDLDLENPSLGVVCGATREDLQFVGELIVPPKWNDIPVMSLSLLPLPDFQDTPTLAEEERKHEIIQSLYHGVNWEGAEFLLVDMPPGSGEEVRGLMTLDPYGAILVTTPQIISEMAVRKVVLMAQEYDIRLFGIVENDVNNSQAGEAGQRISSAYDIPYLTKIEWDARIIEALENHDGLDPLPFAPIAKAIFDHFNPLAHVETPESPGEMVDDSTSKDGDQTVLRDGGTAGEPQGTPPQDSDEVPRSSPTKRGHRDPQATPRSK